MNPITLTSQSSQVCPSTLVTPSPQKKEEEEEEGEGGGLKVDSRHCTKCYSHYCQIIFLLSDCDYALNSSQFK